MAFAVTARHWTNAGQTSAQTRVAGSGGTTTPVAPTASSLFLAFVGAGNDNHTTVPNPVTPTGGGWTYTQRATSGISSAYEWNGTTGYRIAQALYTAAIGGSPSSHTVTVDMYSGTNVGFHTAICCDVTGHDPGGTPLYYTNGANVSTAADNVAGTVTLGASPAVGSLVVVSFYAGADSGGSMTAPTAGAGKTMTVVTSQSNSGYTLQGSWYRVWDGSESNTITCSDLGQQVGNWTAIAVVIPAATGGGATDLVVAGATQAQTSATVALTQVHALAVSPASQAQTSGAPALTQVHALAVDPSTQAQTAGSPVLTQIHVLSVAGATQAQASDSPSLSQVHVLSVDSATHGQTAQSLSLVENSDLAVQGSTQQQTSTTVALTQVHVLEVDDAGHGQTSTTVSLTGELALTVDSAIHGQTAETPTLTQVHALAVDGAVQGQTAGEATLTQLHVLTVQAATQALTSDTVILTSGGSLTAQDALHAQTSSSVALTQQHSLTVADVLQAQAVSLVDLEQEHQLLIAGALHQQLVDELELSLLGEYEAPEEGVAIPRPYYAIAVARPMKTTAVVRSPAATATVRSNDEAG